MEAPCKHSIDRMTQTPHDQFAKQFLEALLTPLGEVRVGLEVPGEAREVDVAFSPNPERLGTAPELGLLSRLVTTPCLLEPFRNQPSPTEVRNCLLKLLLIQAEVQREARRNETRLPEDQLPRLWILASSASDRLLSGFRAQADEENGLTGMYFLGDFLRAAVIAINQLPITPETLWLRLLGKGATQQQAIAELAALPRDNSLRATTLELLFNWRITIESRPDLDEDDQAVIMQLTPLYREQLDEALAQGLQQGVAAERRTTITNLLSARFGALDEPLTAIASTIIQLSAEDYTRLLLQLPSLSREELLTQFQP
jgi:hypothetical protein